MQMVLYLLYMGMHYINMLFFMSYNVGICLAVSSAIDVRVAY